MEKDMLDMFRDERELSDPKFAAVREKVDAVEKLILLRIKLGFSQTDVARRMKVAAARVNETELHPDKVTWERIHAYAAAVGSHFSIIPPQSVEDALVVLNPDCTIDQAKALVQAVKLIASATQAASS